MGLLSFEVKKVLKQKKYVWILLVIFLVTSGMYSMNLHQRSRLQGHWERWQKLNWIRPSQREWDIRESALINRRDRYGLTEDEERQLAYSRQMGHLLYRMRVAIFFERIDEINHIYYRFLENLQSFASYGGEFEALEGIDREIAIEKTRWQTDNNIIYEVEGSPLSQHLFLMQSNSIFLGIIGIIMLLIFFGNTVTEEKERYTWLTIKTQPISKFKLIASKYISYLLMTLFFICSVLFIGLLIPLVINGNTLNLLYPQVLITGEQFMIISTGEYLLRNVLLFFLASSIVFGISVLLSKWVNRSTNLYFLVGILIAFGYTSVSIFDSPINPFYLLSISQILDAVPQHSLWVYFISALCWTSFLLLLTVYIPEPELKGGVYVANKKPFLGGRTNIGKNPLLKIKMFELRKLRREGLLISLFVAILIITLGGHQLLTRITEQRRADYFAELDFRMRASHQNTKEYEYRILSLREEMTSLEQTMTGLEEIEYYLSLIEFEEQYRIKLENAILGYETGDWEKLYQYQLLVTQLAFDRTYPTGHFNFATRETIGRFTKIASIREKEVLMERNLRPILPGEFIPTIHQSWMTSWGDSFTRIGWGGLEVTRDQWERENTRFDNSGLFSLHLSFVYYLYVLLPALLLFLLGGGLAKEKGKKSTINLIKTQPISQGKFFLGKAINSSFIILASTIAVPLIVILVGTVLNRFGDWNYPILFYNSFLTMISPGYTGYSAGGQGGFHFISLARYIMDSVILLGAISLFVVNLSMLISVFFKKAFAVYSCTVVIVLAGYWLNWRRILDLSPNSPFTYFNIPRIVNGELVTILNSTNYNTQRGASILLIFSLLFVLAGYTVVNREGLLKLLADVRTKKARATLY